MTQLETITDNLLNGYNRLKSKSFKDSAQITRERRTNSELRNQWFYVANVAGYEHSEDGSVSVSLGDNVAFNSVIGKDNIEAFCNDLLSDKKYQLSEEQTDKLADLEQKNHVTKVNYSNLGLQKYNDAVSFLEIDTSNFNGLNESETALAKMVYGKSDIKKNMEMLAENGIEKTRIYVMSEKWVRENAEKGEIVSRACWFGSFDNSSNFNADDDDVGNYDGLRGVLDDSSPKATHEKSEVKKTQKYTPNGIIEYLDKNPIQDKGFAQKILNFANDFFQKS